MTVDPNNDLPEEQWHLIDEARERFSSALARGEDASIESALANVPEAVRMQLFKELLAIELKLRDERGTPYELDEYLREYPNYSGQVRLAFGETPPATRIGESTESTLLYAKQKVEFGPSDHADSLSLPRIFGRYKLTRLLGMGGMGAVYLGHDMELDRQVAVKIPKFDRGTPFANEAIARFRREARAMATVEHPNLCPIYDVGEVDGQQYLTMAYIKGQSLWQLLTQKKTLPANEAIRIALRTATALQTAHDEGIIHRDLKPANIMLRLDGEPVIMDFGLATRSRPNEASLTQSGAIVGSPAYMAPEQIDGDQNLIGPQTDVYAMGIILYQMLCGRRPYEGSALSVLSQISSGKSPLPLSQQTQVDPRLEEICMRAMALNVDQRIQTAAEFASLLENVESEPAEAPTQVTFSPTRGASKFVLAVVALIAIATVAFFVSRPLVDPNEDLVGNLDSANETNQGDDQTNSPKQVPAKTTRKKIVPMASIAIGGGEVFGVDQESGKVWHWDGEMWSHIGDSIVDLFWNGSKLFVVNRDNHSVWEYQGKPFDWKSRASHASNVIAIAEQLYKIDNRDGLVHQCDTQDAIKSSPILDQTVRQIATAGKHLWALTTTGEIKRHGSDGTWESPFPSFENVETIHPTSEWMFAVRADQRVFMCKDAGQWIYAGEHVVQMSASGNEFCVVSSPHTVWHVDAGVMPPFPTCISDETTTQQISVDGKNVYRLDDEGNVWQHSPTQESVMDWTRLGE